MEIIGAETREIYPLLVAPSHGFSKHSRGRIEVDQDCADTFNKFEDLNKKQKEVVVKEILNKDPEGRDVIGDSWIPEDDKQKVALWNMMLSGLFAIAALGIGVGALMENMQKDGTVLFALAASVITGIFGLFARPPGSNGSK